MKNEDILKGKIFEKIAEIVDAVNDYKWTISEEKRRKVAKETVDFFNKIEKIL